MTFSDPVLMRDLDQIRSRSRSQRRASPQGLARLLPDPIGEDDHDETSNPLVDGRAIAFGTNALGISSNTGRTSQLFFAAKYNCQRHNERQCISISRVA